MKFFMDFWAKVLIASIIGFSLAVLSACMESKPAQAEYKDPTTKKIAENLYRTIDCDARVIIYRVDEQSYKAPVSVVTTAHISEARMEKLGCSQ